MNHELLQGTAPQDRNVMREIGAPAPYVFRCKRFLSRRFLRNVIADHRVETRRTADLAKVDLLRWSRNQKDCGLFETEQTMKNNGWVIVVFEGEYRQFDGEVAYVKGPFETYEAATDWAENSKDCPGKVGVDGEWQITFIEADEAKKVAA